MQKEEEIGCLKYYIKKVKCLKHSEIMQLLHFFKAVAYVFLYV